nr:uncharacterized protein LOC113822869 [Penaeus vannamei]
MLMEKYREGQELHYVFVDLEKAYDRVLREELWHCRRKSGVAEKYMKVVKDVYDESETAVRRAAGITVAFKEEVGLHKGSTSSPLLLAMAKDRLTDEIRRESPWTMVFANNIVLSGESREEVEEELERWRYALERRGMIQSSYKTEYTCANERDSGETVRLQGVEVKKVNKFKYLRSTV